MTSLASDEGTTKRWVPDVPLCLALTLLLGLGTVMLYSSSAIYAARNYDDAEHFLRLQLQWIALGFVALLICARVPRSWLARRPGWIYLVAVVLCAVVLVPGIGRFVGGARRWLGVGGIGFQPSELAKIALLVMLASLLSRDETRPVKQASGHRLRRIRGPVIVAQIPILLVLAEPDLGTALVMEILVFVMIFGAGLRLRALFVLGLAALPVLYHQIVATPFRLKRLLSYIDPWPYRSSIGYQITEALIAIGSGGVTGVGLGESKQKLFFLPEAHTDFIFAIIAEELGLVGVCLLVTCFAVLIYRGMRLAVSAESSFDRYLALGFTALIGVPAIFNMGVATGLLPTKGLPLPLISYGGSNLVVCMAAVGILLRIDRDIQLGVSDTPRGGTRPVSRHATPLASLGVS